MTHFTYLDFCVLFFVEEELTAEKNEELDLMVKESGVQTQKMLELHHNEMEVRADYADPFATWISVYNYGIVLYEELLDVLVSLTYLMSYCLIVFSLKNEAKLISTCFW